jgi:3-hydroxyisobutyrate dehydrogenase/2-hydroxy-3-oxopropionate reductase
MTTTSDSAGLSFDIGFIGAGNMGKPMIGHLLRGGHRVRALSRRPEIAQSLGVLGAQVATDVETTVRGVQVLCLNVTSTSDVEQVLFGQEGAAGVLDTNAVVIDFSTISAMATREFADRLRERSIAMLDAPVSGGVKGAQAATLSIMVGGDAAVLERVRPLLCLLGSTITHVGANGAGQVAKACNQIVQVVNIQGIAEAMRFASSNGVDLGRVLSAISAGMAGSKMLDLMGPKMAGRNFEAGIEARLHAKDFGVVLEMAAQLGVDLPAATATGVQLGRLMHYGWGQDDTSSLLRVLEEGGAK